MTLTYENEASTIDGFAESAQSQWVAAVSDRCEKTRGVSLAALDGMPISSKFCSWIGQSGRAMSSRSIRRRSVQRFTTRFCSPSFAT